MAAEQVSPSVDVLAAQVRRQREQLRRAAEDGERLYRKRMHEDDWTGADDNRIDGILTRELEDALEFADALVARVTEAERERKAAEEWARVMEHERDYEQQVVSRDLSERLAVARNALERIAIAADERLIRVIAQEVLARIGSSE